MGGEEGSLLIELLFKTSDTSQYKSSFLFIFHFVPSMPNGYLEVICQSLQLGKYFQPRLLARAEAAECQRKTEMLIKKKLIKGDIDVEYF